MFRPPTRSEYEHILNQLFQRGYVLDPNARCTNVEEVWQRWRHLDTDYPFLCMYEGTNVLDAFSTLDKSYQKELAPTPVVDTFPAYSV
jgi:hypothetical protein